MWTTSCCSVDCKPVLNVPQSATNLDRISKTTKELFERGRTLRFNPNALHIERLGAFTKARCKKALQMDLPNDRQKKILEAAQKTTILKKCLRNFCEYSTPLSALLSQESHLFSPRNGNHYGEALSNLFRSTIPVSSPTISTGEAPPRILLSKVVLDI
ncbi:hypothetical protein RB195_007993 [Necator americanus]|uniref:Uncharacterized protein n=1 Tax=Necator americanus TaxID=51031 RepID=A0ABR1BZW9_NECAM